MKAVYTFLTINCVSFSCKSESGVNHAAEELHNTDEPAIKFLRGCFETNTSYWGVDLPHVASIKDVKSVDACQDACAKEKSCHFWDWVRHNTQTYPKHAGWCFLKPAHAIAGRKHFIDRFAGPKYCPGCYSFGKTVTGSAMPGPPLNTSNPLDCQMACQHVEHCHHFVFDADSKLCTLFRRKTGEADSRQADIVSGPRRCPMALWSQWSEWTKCSLSCRKKRRRVCFKVGLENSSCEGDVEGRGTESEVSNCWTDGNCFIRQRVWLYSMVAVGTLTTVLMFACIVCACCYRRGSTGRKYSSRASAMLRYMGSGSNWLGRGGQTPASIPVDQFQRLVNEEKLPGWNEFRELRRLDKTQNQLPSSTSQGKRQNRKLSWGTVGFNRQASILPYDQNLVSLSYPLKGTTYVNASWVSELSAGGSVTAVRAIAAQSPMPNTVHHFLQMAQENSVDVVVALSDDEDELEYWIPDRIISKTGFNRMAVTRSDSVRADNPCRGCITREVTVRNERQEDRDAAHTFTQIRIDFARSVSLEAMVATVHRVQDLETWLGKAESGDGLTVLVHSRTGTGPTGVWLALYKISSLLRRKTAAAVGEIDVFNACLELGKYRMKLIDTEEQYRFLYECVAYELHSASANPYYYYTSEVDTEKTKDNDNAAMFVTKMARDFSEL